MTTKLSKLIQLGAKADSLIQLGRYDIEDGDTKMLKDAAIAGGVGVGGFFGGRKLMKIGDELNEKRYNAIVQGGPKVGQVGGAIGIDHLGAAGEASPFVKGIKKLPTAEEFKGSSIRSIGTGLKNVFGRLRKAIRLSAKLDRIISFDIEDGVIGAGLVGGVGAAGYGLHRRGSKIKRTAEEGKEYMRSQRPFLESTEARKPAYRKGVLKAYMAKPSEDILRNIEVGAGDLLKSGKKSLRTWLK